ncbi:MAG: DUF4139 domain-containing protein [Deltaproteobacteria bacterium]|nr:DUF4139 domain-containing protein [Deltaproteobacteria bacterium]
MKRMIISLGVVGLVAVCGEPQARAEEAVDSVLVYSEGARVFRRAEVQVQASTAEVSLGHLPQGIDLSSLRVESKTLTVLGVDLVWASGPSERSERAKRLREQIEQINAERRLIDDELGVLRRENDWIRGLAFDTRQDDKHVLPRIDPASWRRVLEWIDQRLTAVRKRQAALAAKRPMLEQQLHKLQVEAGPLLKAAVGQAERQVRARIKGTAGRHRLVLSYMVSGSRWRPSYDLYYRPDSGRVELAYYALVSQTSREDWSDARLRFSTALPTRLNTVPELPVWTLARRRDFIPRPRPRGERVVQRWRGPAEPTRGRAVELLALRQVVEDARPTTEASADIDGVADEQDKAAEREAPAPIRPASPSPVGGGDEGKKGPYQFRRRAVRFEAGLEKGDIELSSASIDLAPGRRSIATEQIAFADFGYRRREPGADTPAGAAKGLRYVLWAPGRHSVESDGQSKRVPLFRRTLEATTVHRLVPGKSKRAYVMGKLVNRTGRPILRGHANLFFGSMYAGASWLNTALPGHELELPLGVDDQVNVERHTQQHTKKQGVIFHDDVSRYTVTIELANHRGRAIRCEVLDQVPIAAKNGKIKIGSFSADPAMDPPDRQGRIRWQGTLGPREKRTLRFSFEIVRPVGMKLRQTGG